MINNFINAPFQEGSFTKSYWGNKGLNHTYFDIHGRNGSKILDLSKDNEVTEQYDIVTDFGTLEHIEDFYMGFKNFHNLCKPGGLMIHVLPSLGHWPDHGSWRGPMSFFFGLAKKNDYEVLNLYEEKTSFGGADSNQIYAAFQKIYDKDFISLDEFQKLGPVKVGEEKYEEGVGRVA